jgi:hypothetical protein
MTNTFTMTSRNGKRVVTASQHRNGLNAPLLWHSVFTRSTRRLTETRDGPSVKTKKEAMKAAKKYCGL